MTTVCRAFVGGFGRPGTRDFDFGRQLIDCLQQLEWPEGVVVEDLPCAVPLVLHRLQELRPAKVVLLGAVARGLDRPGTVRRYQVRPTPSDPEEVLRGLEESLMGLSDLDHTLAVARHWGHLPVDTVVIEVEPAETSFGLGFSDELAACIDPILDMVHEELGDVAGGEVLHPDLVADDIGGGVAAVDGPATGPHTAEPSEAMTDLVSYARRHAEARCRSGQGPSPVDGLPPTIPGVALAGRVKPWGVFLENGGDWFDAVPLDDGRWGIVVGNVAGRGAEVAATTNDLRAAVRAYLILDGGSPGRLLGHVDRLAAATGLGQQSRLVYLTLDPSIGEVRFANAGSCPPLLLDSAGRTGRFVDTARSPAVGEGAGVERPEATVQLAAGSTLLLFTDGLVECRTVSRTEGLDRLQRAATEGPAALEDLCDHVLEACSRSLRRDDDICLLGVRLTGPSTANGCDPDACAEAAQIRDGTDVLINTAGISGPTASVEDLEPASVAASGLGFDEDLGVAGVPGGQVSQHVCQTIQTDGSCDERSDVESS